MQTAEKYFSVIVGGKPAQVLVGFIDEANGQPKHGAVPATISKAGTAIPNYSTVWGKQVRDSKTKQLTGDIEFLPWEHPDGYLVETRYLTNCTSIDLEFQREVKKLTKFQDKDAEIHLEMGVNNFNKITQKTLINMLEHHYLNGMNESRPPNMPIAFNTYDPKKLTEKAATDIERRQSAETVVLAARYDDKGLEILAHLFGMDPRQQTDLIFNDLLERVSKYENFLEVMDYHRGEYELLMQKSRELGLIDCDGIGVIYLIRDDRRDELFKGLEAKDPGGKFLEILTNFQKPQFFQPLTTLKEAYTKFENAVLQ